MTFGSIDKETERFRGQFMIDGTTYYLEDAEKYLPNATFDSVMYRGTDVVDREEDFEPEELPTAPGFKDEDDTAVHFGDVRNNGDNNLERY